MALFCSMKVVETSKGLFLKGEVKTFTKIDFQKKKFSFHAWVIPGDISKNIITAHLFLKM